MKKILEQIFYYIICMRPKQWIKNIIIFIPLIFSGEITHIYFLSKTIAIFLLFSIFVWATYVLNDIKDLEKDKLHPKKKNRPLASWKLNKKFAFITSILGIVLIRGISVYTFGRTIGILFAGYLANTIIYTYYLKHQVIIDVFSIAIWFVIRGLIGIYAVDVIISPWLLVVLFFWALFLGFLKRYQEVMLWKDTRHNISLYNSEFLKQIISMLTTVILMAYTLYTFNSSQSQLMLITLPFVAFWIIRYYYNIFYLQKYEEGIEDIIIKDKRIFFDIIIWFIVTILLILM